MKRVINNEKGASAVEFAIVLPVLVIMVFGIIEFGIVFYNKAMITNACREAARTAIVYRTPVLDETQMQKELNSVVKTYLAAPSDPSGSTTILIPGSTPAPEPVLLPPNKTCFDPGVELDVTLGYDYSFIMLPDFLADFFSGGLPGTIKIETVTKMRCE